MVLQLVQAMELFPLQVYESILDHLFPFVNDEASIGILLQPEIHIPRI